jgi:Mn2+/Fe2+ NRAMP family transporter
LALFVNAAILIVAAAAFFDPSGSTQDAPSVSEAYDLLAPVLGEKVRELGEGYFFFLFWWLALKGHERMEECELPA